VGVSRRPLACPDYGVVSPCMIFGMQR
jgi:hypothetical protein